ncbi:MAG: IclR family transcriptional regulator [Paracoccaceae bacterium]
MGNISQITSRQLPEHGGAQSILRAANLLREVGLRRSVGLAELTAATGLSKPTVRRMLLALINVGLVAQNPETKQYKLGVDAYLLGQLAETPYNFHELSRDGIARLAEVSGDTAYLSIRQGDSTFCLHREEGKYPIRTHVLHIGDRQPLSVGAASMAVLAALPKVEADAIMENNIDKIRDSYPDFDMEKIYTLVAEARIQGWALNPGLAFAGSWAIAVAVRDPEGQVLGAITIAAIEARLDAKRQLELSVPLVKEAKRLEKLMRQAHGESRPVASLLTHEVRNRKR